MASKRAPGKAAQSVPRPHVEAGSDAVRNPLHDHLKALEELQRLSPHGRLFESLFGAHVASVSDSANAYKIPTFEDLFDERVQKALERRGHTQELADLHAEVKRLDERLRRLERLLGPAPKSKSAKG